MQTSSANCIADKLERDRDTVIEALRKIPWGSGIGFSNDLFQPRSGLTPQPYLLCRCPARQS